MNSQTERTLRLIPILAATLLLHGCALLPIPGRQASAIDPGVLCPNAALEAIAWRDPQSKADLQDLPGVKGWFVKEFAAEVAQINRGVRGSSRSDQPA